MSTYEARVARVTAAAAGKEPDRVPIMPLASTFAIGHYGSSMAEVTYNTQKGVYTSIQFCEDFQPDAATGFYTNIGKGPIFELIKPKACVWPGAPDKRVTDDSYHQFLEFAVLTEDEMDWFERDYTGWLLQRGLPKVAAIMEPFENWNTGMLGVNYDISQIAAQFSRPEMREVIKTFWQIDDMNREIAKISAAGRAKLEAMGFPNFAGQPGGGVPFDSYSDFIRGTLDSMVDMYNNRKLIERYSDWRLELMLENIRAAGRAGPDPNKWASFILHKGMDGFMDDEQYANLYWKYLQRLIEECIAVGFQMVYVYTEGPYTSRLDHLAEVTPGKVIYHFEEVDLELAKRKLGNVACIAGGYSVYHLHYGTRKQVVDEVKRTLDICAPGGGYIFETGSAFGKSPVENVEAMYETVKSYGKY